MNDTINLLKNNAIVEKKSNTARFLRLASILSLFFIAFSAVGMFFLRSQSRFAILQQQEDTLQRELSTLQDKVAKFVLVKDRVRAITLTLNQRSAVSVILDVIATKVPKEASIESLKIDETKIELNVSSTSLLPIETFFENMTAKQEKQLFQKITMQNLSYDPKNVRYSVVLRIDYHE